MSYSLKPLLQRPQIERLFRKAVDGCTGITGGVPSNDKWKITILVQTGNENAVGYASAEVTGLNNIMHETFVDDGK